MTFLKHHKEAYSLFVRFYAPGGVLNPTELDQFSEYKSYFGCIIDGVDLELYGDTRMHILDLIAKDKSPFHRKSNQYLRELGVVMGCNRLLFSEAHLKVIEWEHGRCSIKYSEALISHQELDYSIERSKS